jgi:hypothetical protein
MFLSYEIESIDIYGYLLSMYCIIVCNCEPEKYLGYLTVQISLGNHLPLSTPGRYGTDVFVYLNSLGSRRLAPSHHCLLVGHNYVSFSENNMFQPSNHWWSCCLKTALRSKELWWKLSEMMFDICMFMETTNASWRLTFRWCYPRPISFFRYQINYSNFGAEVGDLMHCMWGICFPWTRYPSFRVGRFLGLNA